MDRMPPTNAIAEHHRRLERDHRRHHDAGGMGQILAVCPKPEASLTRSVIVHGVDAKLMLTWRGWISAVVDALVHRVAANIEPSSLELTDWSFIRGARQE